jgi:hypothetical protein
MSKDQGSGDRISGVVTGPAQGQVAIGKGIAQHQATGSMTMELSDAERGELRDLFAELKHDVARALPQADRDVAIERIDELHEAVAAAPPDLTTVEYVKQWFARKLPVVAGIVASVLVHPLVGSIVTAAGDRVAGQIIGPSQGGT